MVIHACILRLFSIRSLPSWRGPVKVRPQITALACMNPVSHHLLRPNGAYYVEADDLMGVQSSGVAAIQKGAWNGWLACCVHAWTDVFYGELKIPDVLVGFSTRAHGWRIWPRTVGLESRQEIILDLPFGFQ